MLDSADIMPAVDGIPPRLLSIAGSDSGGGAGIQADLKAFARCGAHGMTAVTAITAQNTVEVRSVVPVPGDEVIAQVRAVVEDIGVDAVKIGMLGGLETILAVEAALRLVGEAPVVLDPVMVSESGASLLDPDAAQALVERLLPLATVTTPNLAEARALSRTGPDADGESLARAVRDLGPRAVVVTGGHRDEAVDLYLDDEDFETLAGQRHPEGSAHGSGCTHSSALAAGLAWGLEPLEAARHAKAIASEAVRNGLRAIGSGPGPVDVLALRRSGSGTSGGLP